MSDKFYTCSNPIFTRHIINSNSFVTVGKNFGNVATYCDRIIGHYIRPCLPVLHICRCIAAVIITLSTTSKLMAPPVNAILAALAVGDHNDFLKQAHGLRVD